MSCSTYSLADMLSVQSSAACLHIICVHCSAKWYSWMFGLNISISNLISILYQVRNILHITAQLAAVMPNNEIIKECKLFSYFLTYL